MPRLPQMLSINEDDMGEFEPKGSFLEQGLLYQIDILNDWSYDLEQYRKHLLCEQFLRLEQKHPNGLSWNEKMLAFRTVITQFGIDFPDGFEAFIDAHRKMTSLPVKPCSCPICNPGLESSQSE